MIDSDFYVAEDTAGILYLQYSDGIYSSPSTLNIATNFDITAILTYDAQAVLLKISIVVAVFFVCGTIGF